MKTLFSYCIIFLLIFGSCSQFSKETEEAVVARVGDKYLSQEELFEMIPDGLSEQDSITNANNAINRWAAQQLLMQAAKININQDKQETFDQLIEQYKVDLYTNAYREALVKQKIDTSVSFSQAESIYNRNKESFRLNEELIKLRYIQLDEQYQNTSEIKERLKRFDQEDQYILDSIALQFKSYSLNDSIWVQLNKVVEKIPAVTPTNKNELLKKSNFVERKDSLGLYLVHVKDVLLRNDIAPLEYVLPTIKQIVINERKLEFIKGLEKDITKDALQNNEFEIYNE